MASVDRRSGAAAWTDRWRLQSASPPATLIAGGKRRGSAAATVHACAYDRDWRQSSRSTWAAMTAVTERACTPRDSVRRSAYVRSSLLHVSRRRRPLRQRCLRVSEGALKCLVFVRFVVFNPNLKGIGLGEGKGRLTGSRSKARTRAATKTAFLRHSLLRRSHLSLRDILLQQLKDSL